MEVRKIQSTGGSSFIVTLPKKWAKANKLKKNESITVIERANGTITISPFVKAQGNIKKKTLKLDKIKNQRDLFRLLVAAYVTGHTEIEIESEKRINTTLRESVSEFAQLVIGPEVVHEDSNKIVLKDLLNPSEMPFEKTIKRLKTLVITMHEDAVNSLQTTDRKLAKDVIRRDAEVNRLHWLIYHQYSLLLEDVRLSEMMNIGPDKARYYFLISWVMERIADHAKTIAQKTPKIFDEKYVKNKIKKASEYSLKLFKASMESLINSDVELANNTINNISDIYPLCDAVSQAAAKKDAAKSNAILHISESIKRTGEYSKNICEFSINKLIKDIGCPKNP